MSWGVSDTKLTFVNTSIWHPNVHDTECKSNGLIWMYNTNSRVWDVDKVTYCQWMHIICFLPDDLLNNIYVFNYIMWSRNCLPFRSTWVYFVDHCLTFFLLAIVLSVLLFTALVSSNFSYTCALNKLFISIDIIGDIIQWYYFFLILAANYNQFGAKYI